MVTYNLFAGSEVFTAVWIQTVVLWVAAPCSNLVVHQRFGRQTASFFRAVAYITCTLKRRETDMSRSHPSTTE